MLVELFLLIWVYPSSLIFQGVLSILPTFDFLQNSLAPVADAFVWFFGIMAKLDPIFPYETQLNILTVIIGYYALLFTFKLVSWILRKIPFINLS